MEDQGTWLEEWLEKNDVKTLNDCKLWKDGMPLLQSAVLGIPTVPGHGCTECNFGHDRQRNVIAHMRNVHNIQDMASILVSVQHVFTSHLRGFWRITTAQIDNEITDEGLTMLHQFSTEFHKFQLEDRPSSIGM